MPNAEREAGACPFDYNQLAVDLAFKDYGMQAHEHRITSCGSHTGHTVKDMALAITPEVADFIVRACNSHYALYEALTWALAEIKGLTKCTPEQRQACLDKAEAALALVSQP